MILSVGNKKKKYRVYFDHCLTETPDSMRGTFCTIRPMRTPGVQFVDMAVLNPKDTFCKSTGRKVALAKAMKLAQLDKATRTALWKSYFKICPIT